MRHNAGHSNTYMYSLKSGIFLQKLAGTKPNHPFLFRRDFLMLLLWLKLELFWGKTMGKKGIDKQPRESATATTGRGKITKKRELLLVI